MELKGFTSTPKPIKSYSGIHYMELKATIAYEEAKQLGIPGIHYMELKAAPCCP